MSGIALSHNEQINPAKARCFDQFKGLDFFARNPFLAGKVGLPARSPAKQAIHLDHLDTRVKLRVFTPALSP